MYKEIEDLQVSARRRQREALQHCIMFKTIKLA